MNIPSSLITLSTLLMILRSQIYFPIPIISSKNVEQLPAEPDRLAVKLSRSFNLDGDWSGSAIRFGGNLKKKGKAATLFLILLLN